MEKVDIDKIYNTVPLSEQEQDPDLASRVKQFLKRMQEPEIEKLKKTRVWVINSTSGGGGVAELLPRIMAPLRELNITIEWLTMSTFDEPEFFLITKKIHNFIHGQNPSNVSLEFSQKEKEIFEKVNRKNAQDFIERFLKPGDIVAIHDPQPIGMITEIRKRYSTKEVPCVWRCHIGYEHETQETKSAWNFIKEYVVQYDYTVFTAPEYIPSYAPNPRVITPSIQPTDLKNKFLSFPDTKLILAKCGLINVDKKYLTEEEKYKYKVKIFKCGEPLAIPVEEAAPEEFGILDRPLILQISRWDKLKGFSELIDAFADLKQHPEKYIDRKHEKSKEWLRYIERLGLVLAGPDASKIDDDPEALAVIRELMDKTCTLPSKIRESMLLLSLPLEVRWQNSLIVNALRSLAEINVQNSIREGFGLTLAEAMWKQKPCIATDVCGLRQQLRDKIDGLIVKDPCNPENLAKAFGELIQGGYEKREEYAKNAKKRIIDKFLVYSHITKYCDILREMLEKNLFET